MKINPYLQNFKNAYKELSNHKQETTSNALSADSTNRLKEMGVSSGSDMQKAYKIYSSTGKEPSKSTMAETQKFFDKTPGSSDDKMLTIQVASAKGIDVTEGNLTAIHSALNDSANDALTVEGLMEKEFSQAEAPIVETDGETTAGTGKGKAVNVPDKVKKEVYSALEEMGYTEAEATEIGDRLIAGESVGSILADQHRKMIAQFTKDTLGKLSVESGKKDKNVISALLALEKSVKITITQIKIEITQTGEISADTGIDLSDVYKLLKEGLEGLVSSDVSEALEKIVDQTTAELGAGSEGSTSSAQNASSATANGSVSSNETTDGNAISGGNAANGTVAKTEDSAKDNDLQGLTEEELEDLLGGAGKDFFEQMENLVDRVMEQLGSAYGDADLQSLFESSTTKTYLVTEVTVKMTEVKATFDQFKKDALNNINQGIEKASSKTIAEVVTKVAEKLDDLIMKSDLTLYTDMKTERKLIGISSNLQNVLNLAKTDPNEALKALKETKAKLDKLLFQPSKEKVEVVLKSEAEKMAGIEKAMLSQEVAKVGTSAKSVLDLMRSLGLNHEVELMDQIFSNGSDSTDLSDDTKFNLKQMLLNLTSEDLEDQQQLVKSIEKGISQLTGQQLLNKPEIQSDTQSMFFNLPLNLGEQTQNMKLYVKARKDVQKMDWENCSMYVLVDLNRYGETGIRIQANQKQLSVSISNESDEIMTVIAPFVSDIMAEFKEIGYNPGEIKYVPFTPENKTPSELPKTDASEKTVAAEVQEGVFSERKGFELKI